MPDVRNTTDLLTPYAYDLLATVLEHAGPVEFHDLPEWDDDRDEILLEKIAGDEGTDSYYRLSLGRRETILDRAETILDDRLDPFLAAPGVDLRELADVLIRAIGGDPNRTAS